MIITSDNLEGMEVKSKVTGYKYTILKYRNHKKHGPQIHICNWAGCDSRKWWSYERFDLIIPKHLKAGTVVLVLL